MRAEIITEPGRIFAELIKWGTRRWKLSADDARDIAAEALVVSFEKGCMELPFAVAVMHHGVKHFFAKRTRRRTNTFSEVPEGVDLERAVRPAQLDHVMASQCLFSIEQLPEHVRDVMRLTALEWKPQEIQRRLKLSFNELQHRLTYGRRLLRDRGLFDESRQTGFIGVRRNKRKWVARICDENGARSIGSYPTAAAAAHAYDAEARRMRGASAKLNFPELAAAPAHRERPSA